MNLNEAKEVIKERLLDWEIDYMRRASASPMRHSIDMSSIEWEQDFVQWLSDTIEREQQEIEDADFEDEVDEDESLEGEDEEDGKR